jgi:thymidine phosphorylase
MPGNRASATPEPLAGRLVLVVGPSGAGKDTVLSAARARLGDTETSGATVFARRAITRPADAGGERHEAVSEADFAAVEAAGGYLLSWRAHGLAYGIPARYRDDLAAGRQVVANVSRGVVAQACARWPNCLTVVIDAPLALRAERLALRGREPANDVAARLYREAGWTPPTDTRIVVNDDTPERAVDAFLAAIAQSANS